MKTVRWLRQCPWLPAFLLSNDFLISQAELIDCDLKLTTCVRVRCYCLIEFTCCKYTRSEHGQKHEAATDAQDTYPVSIDWLRGGADAGWMNVLVHGGLLVSDRGLQEYRGNLQNVRAIWRESWN